MISQIDLVSVAGPGMQLGAAASFRHGLQI